LIWHPGNLVAGEAITEKYLLITGASCDACYRTETAIMKDEIHVRDAQAAPRRARIRRWRDFLREDREGGFAQPERLIDDLYDDATGLPAE
jgi:hypothetical protein